MKRLTCLLLSALLLLSLPGLAEDAGPLLDSTRAFTALMDAADYDYELHGLIDGGDEHVTASMTGDNGYEIEAQLFFEGSGEYADLYVWNLIDFDASRLTEMYRVCNDLNSDFRFVCFFVDEEDCSVNVSFSLILGGDAESGGEIAFEAFLRLCIICDMALAETLAAYAL